VAETRSQLIRPCIGEREQRVSNATAIIKPSGDDLPYMRNSDGTGSMAEWRKAPISDPTLNKPIPSPNRQGAA